MPTSSLYKMHCPILPGTTVMKFTLVILSIMSLITLAMSGCPYLKAKEGGVDMFSPHDAGHGHGGAMHHGVVAKEGEGCTGCGCSSNSRKTAVELNPESFTFSDEATKRSETNGMVHIEIPVDGFIMGTDKPSLPADGEGPARRVTLDSFWMDVHEVSNADFNEFVVNTGYITEVSLY